MHGMLFKAKINKKKLWPPYFECSGASTVAVHGLRDICKGKMFTFVLPTEMCFVFSF